MANGNRVPELDLLRCIAVVLVLFRHVLAIPENLSWPVKAFFLSCRNFGWIGVDLFFVLSGFLVSGLLFSEYRKDGRVRPFLFLFRRAMKLYPAFYAFLLITLVLKWLLEIPPLTLRGTLGEAIFLQNYLGALWAHTWSLAIEEHFYIALVIGLSVLGALSRRDAFKMLPGLCLGACCLLTAVRTVLAYRYSYTWEHILTFTHFRIDSLLFGVFLSYEYHHYRERFVALFRGHAAAIAVCCLGMIGAVTASSLEDPFVISFGLTFLYVGFGGLMGSLIAWRGGPKEKFFTAVSPFTFLGRHSYSVYLWHYFVYILSVGVVRWFWRYDDFAVQVLFYFGGTFAIGVGMSLLVEQPFLRLRDRYFPSRGSAFPGDVSEPPAGTSPGVLAGS